MAGAAGACAALCGVLTKLTVSSEIVTRLACEAIYELCFDESNRHLFAIVGACELIVTTLNTHIHHAQTAQHVCRAITGLAKVSTHYNQNPDLLGAAGACHSVARVIHLHMLSSSLVEAGCSAIAALCFNGHEKNQNIFAQLSTNSNTTSTTSSSDINNGAAHTGHSISSGSHGSVKLSSPMKPSPEKNSASTSRSSALVHQSSVGSSGMKPTTLSTIHGSSSSTSSSGSDGNNIFLLLTQSLQTHRPNPSVCAQACRAARANSTGNGLVRREFSAWGLLPPVVKVLKTHRNVEVVVEHTCWLLANIIAPTVSGETDDDAASNEGGGGGNAVTDLIDLNIIDTSSAAPAAATAGVTVNSSAQPNSMELYRSSSNWDVLLSTLQINYQKQTLARWVCAAIR